MSLESVADVGEGLVESDFVVEGSQDTSDRLLFGEWGKGNSNGFCKFSVLEPQNILVKVVGRSSV